VNKRSGMAVERRTLLIAVELVKHAAAKEKNGSILSRISIYSKGNETIDVAAANGFLLAIYNMPATTEGEFGGVFPLDILFRLKEIKEEKVVIDIPDKDIARIDGRGIELISNWCPDFRRLIPEGFTHKVTFNLKELKEALEVVKVVAKKGLGRVRLETTKVGTMKIWSEFEDEMIAREILVDTEDLPGKIAIHWRNLRDALKTGVNTISFNELVQPVELSKAQPCVFTGIPHFIEAVQPMIFEW